VKAIIIVVAGIIHKSATLRRDSIFSRRVWLSVKRKNKTGQLATPRYDILENSIFVPASEKNASKAAATDHSTTAIIRKAKYAEPGAERLRNK
jgi:hypothetical protein